MKFAAAVALSVSLLAAPVAAQTASDWRTIEPQNLLVIDTAKGRILVELDPRVAPLAVERVRTLAEVEPMIEFLVVDEPTVDEASWTKAVACRVWFDRSPASFRAAIFFNSP